ncbi:CRIB domain-containing protein RIC2-like isoform X1 [Zingiber officinale]|uniref:CRIB domain-containing protein RIC2-like isoform X1 n=1 Tax=Zingiber officinale TaxID=94328 RepID=UPI001C4A8995|nr:CRIB domain-containing protein RIC2-like isoform X1 [Zingiber officinale]
MRERRMDRFVILPFSVGCVSQSSVAVCENQSKKGRAETAAPAPTPSTSGKPRNSFNVLPFPRPPSIASGFQKLAKSIKSLSHYFVFEESEEEEEEMEMEIGFPTDVQHVAHIGLDGLSHTMSNKKSSWDTAPPEFLPLPSFSMKQFELAMAAQAGAPPPPPPPHGPHGSWLH